jgi:hypothetical protein
MLVAESKVETLSLVVRRGHGCGVARVALAASKVRPW